MQDPGSTFSGRQRRVQPARHRHEEGEHPCQHSKIERSEEHTSELQSQSNLVCRLLLEKKTNDANSAGRQLLRLGEAEVIEMRLSRDVLEDLEYVVSRRKPDLLKDLALLLDQANFDLVS